MANKGKPFSDDVAHPRITFHAPGRTFDRLLKESSLSDLKDTVRKKLGLESGTMIQFVQIRQGQLVDLEDEDDFDAFCAVAHEQRHATVQLVLTENSIAKDSRNVDAKGGNPPISDAPLDGMSSASPLPPTPASALPSTGRLNANLSTFDPGAAVFHKKVVLKNEDGIEVNLETLTTKVSPTPPTPSVTARQNLPATPTRKTAPIRIETPEQRLKRLEEEQKEKEAKAKASAEERASIHAYGPHKLTGRFFWEVALVRPLEDLISVTYPEGIRGPKPELNIGAKGGKFRYDRDFLMQFMSICKEKPNFLIPLDAFGLEPLRHGPGDRSVSMTSGNIPFPNLPLQGTANQEDVQSIPGRRTRTKRGEKRSEASKTNAAAVGPQAHEPTYGQPHAAPQTPILDPVNPFSVTENRWNKKSFPSNNPDSPEVVDMNVKALLNKLTVEEFDSISDQIIQWANRSENQKDGRTLIQVIRLVFEKATDEATWSEMCARLCRKMMEQISLKVQDEGIRNSEGMPMAGGQLFRKYLLNRCQEEFERGRSPEEAVEDQAVKAANGKSESGEIAGDSDEYYVVRKAKRQGLGLIKFIGELFKLQMLTERIMHGCIRDLLGNVQNPVEEDIESLCTLLTTVGSLLDTRNARTYLDIYFQRMQEISKNASPRMQFILQDVIELRGRKWQARNAVVTPTTITQVHESAVKEKVDTEKEDIHRLSISFGSSRRGGTRDDYPQTDGWSSVSRATARAGDLSQFGRISKTQPPTMFGPSSVFAGKELKREPVLRTNSSSNMFSALQGTQQESNKAAEQPSQRKKRLLQPRTKPVEEPTPPSEESVTPSSKEAPVSVLTAVNAKISEDVKEFFSIRNLDEAEVYFTTLPSQHHHRLVNKLVSSAVESKEPDAVLVADLFTRVNSKGLCSSDAFEEGLTPTAEIIEDIAIDAPKAWTLFAMMVKGAKSNEDHRTRLASKTADGDKLLGLLSDVIELRERKWQARNAVTAPTAIA